MALFRRKKTEKAAVPPEIQNYYQAEGRERTGVAWLLALVTLLATILIVLGLFFGGRWVYRKINQPDKVNTPVKVQTDTSTNKPSTTPTPQTGSNAPNTGSPTPPTAPTPPAPTPSPAPGAPVAGSNLPNTGPGDILALFVLASLAGTLLHTRLSRSR